MSETVRATIADVAERAGVSIATVSRAVNGRYGVAPATVARVERVVAELGYTSSLAASGMRGRRTNVIGILVADIEPFSAELLKGVAVALRDSGFEMLVYAAGRARDTGWEKRSLSRLGDTLTDGIILVTPSLTEVYVEQPVVAVDPHVGGSALPSVDAQNREGALAVTEYLIGLGHRRIAFLAGRPDLESARLRQDGYCAALAAHGIEFDPELVGAGDFTEVSAAGSARRLLTIPDPPTAVFAANDLSAIGTLRVADELGLRVPDDLSIVGFDNIPESALTEPPLTTVDQAIQGQGIAAARLLVELIERGTADTTHIRLPTHVVVRRSCAPPGGDAG